MLIRIVKLQFKPENIPSFERVFEASKSSIMAFEGCSKVELYQDLLDPGTFFTYSHWTDQAALEAYRDSDFFREVWGRTKKLFSERAQAWSVKKI